MTRSTVLISILFVLALSVTAIGVWRVTERGSVGEGLEREFARKDEGTRAALKSVETNDAGPRSDRTGEPIPQVLPGEASRSRVAGCDSNRVVDERGQPLSGVELTWDAPNPRWIGRPGAEQTQIETPTRGVRAYTGEDGCFEFEAAPEGAESGESVLWATRSGFRAEPRSFAAGTHSVDIDKLVLIEWPPIEVTVLDASGAPVPGAAVISVLADDPGGPAGAQHSPLERSALRRVTTTDAEGTARVPAFPGEQLVRASLDGRASSIWEGRAPARLRMQLVETFTFSGRVHAADPALKVGELRVTVRALLSGVSKTLERAMCGQDGAFGPLSVPAVRADELVVRLEGGDSIPVERRLVMPTAGERIDIRFDVESGLGALVRVEDEDANPVPSATVEAWWRSGEGWGSSRTRTEADGVARLRGISPGDVHFIARAPGYSEQRTAVVRLDGSAPVRFLIELIRARPLSGRVLFDGEPVSDFRVLYWNELGGEVSSISVTASATGEFEIESAPGSGTVLLASGPGAAPSRPVTVDTRAAEADEVILELSQARTARGRVLDAATAEPIEAATVHLWTVFAQAWKAPAGPTARCDGDGYFSLEGLGVGENNLAIRSADHAQSWSTVQIAGDGVADLGTFLLVRAQNLRVQLTADGLEPAQCRVGVRELQGSDRSFTASGEATFEAVTPGDWTVWVELPDGTRLEQFVYLSSGRPWTVRFEVDPEDGKGLDVHVISDEPLPNGLRVRSITGLGPSWTRRRSVPVESGRCRIPGPLGEELTLSLWDEFQQLLSVQHVGPAELRAGRVEIDFQGARRSLRVLDTRREPLSRVRAVLTVLGDRSQWRGWGDTDGEGRVTLSVPPRTPLVLHLMLPEGGAVADLPVDFDATEGAELEMIVDARGTLDVRYHDDGVPIPSVASSLISPSGFRCAYLSFSDAEGRARVASLAPGAYTLDVPHPGVWPVQIPIEIGSSPSILDVQLRRLGALDLALRSAEGLPISGVRIELSHEEFGADVSTWIAESRVPSPPTGLITGPTGHLRLSGIPSGPYRYRVTTPDGREAQGQLVVPAHAVGAVVVVVE